MKAPFLHFETGVAHFQLGFSLFEPGDAFLEFCVAAGQRLMFVDQVLIQSVIMVISLSAYVIYMASLPLEANVQFLTVLATKMPFIGRG